MNSLKQQPLMAEVLSGFTTLAIIVAGYLRQNPSLFQAIIHSQNAATFVSALGVIALLAAWILGTLFNSMRDILEQALDRRWPINWSYFLTASPESVKQLEEWWFSYYILQGNYMFAVVTTIVFCFSFSISLPASWLICLGIVAIVFLLDFISLRGELVRLMTSVAVTTTMPHDGVVVRLGMSQAKPSRRFPVGTPGIGVFALTNIKQGSDVFGADDDPTVSVSRSDVDTLPENLRKLYYDFAVLEKGKFICPVNFNKITPSWYLCDSDDPNVVIDKDLRFRALKDIKEGDELTARYSDYSEHL